MMGKATSLSSIEAEEAHWTVTGPAGDDPQVYIHGPDGVLVCVFAGSREIELEPLDRVVADRIAAVLNAAAATGIED